MPPERQRITWTAQHWASDTWTRRAEPTGEGDRGGRSELADLIETVKCFQRSLDVRQAWIQHCANYGRGSLDPALSLGHGEQ